MLAIFQDGWALDWLGKALTPGVVMGLLVLVWLTAFSVRLLNRIDRLETTVGEIKADMVRGEDLDLSIQRIGDSLKTWADGRFLPRTECEQITNGHSEQLRDLREEISQYRRRSTDR